MTEPDAADRNGAPGTWLRLSCPACGGWVGVPNDSEGTRREVWVARRIDVFMHRHRHHRMVAVDVDGDG
jgi:hypothetical protein